MADIDAPLDKLDHWQLDLGRMRMIAKVGFSRLRRRWSTADLSAAEGVASSSRGRPRSFNASTQRLKYRADSTYLNLQMVLDHW